MNIGESELINKWLKRFLHKQPLPKRSPSMSKLQMEDYRRCSALFANLRSTGKP